jgi:Tol biopolymer transport system component
LGWIALLVVMTALSVALAIPAARYLRETSPPEMRLQIVTPPTKSPYQFALSPDGRHIVFLASGDGPQRLWLQPLDKIEARPMSGTDGADFPFWSADSRSIGFFASGKLYRIDIAGGPPQPLTNTSATTARGGAWNMDGTILFAPMPNGPLSRIAASGGEPVVVTRLDPPRQLGHRFPQFLPDGRHFIFYATGNPEASGIYLGSLDGGDPKRLTAADTAGTYLKPDRIVFVHHGALVARRLDLGHGELTGDLVTLADRVGIDVYRGGFSVSTDGRVAYRVGGRAERRQLTWLDRTGKAVGVAGEPEATNLLFPELSPDGRRVAMVRTVENNQAVWLMDLVRGGFTRFTSDVAADFAPLWSPPDGAWIAFSSNRTGTNNLYLKPSNSNLAGPEELLRETQNNKLPQDWSKDGRFLLYVEFGLKMTRDLWALEMTGKERKPRVVVNTQFEERMGQFSPDGRWVAYETNESGQFEIVVQPFPEPSDKWPVSTSGGNQPRWRADGKEIYFIAPDGMLMGVPITTHGSTFQAGAPMALFPTRIPAGGGAGLKHQYAVSRDGRFLINQTVEQSTIAPITLILNWKP